MAFNALNLSSPHDTSIREWKYKTTDSLATVLAAGYFDVAGTSWFNLGDIIKVQIVDNTVSELATTVINVTLEIASGV